MGWTGVEPFGWRRPADDEQYRGLDLVLNEREAELLREAVQRVIGGASVREVAHRWNSRGERTRSGAYWRDTSLRRMLRRPYLAGHLPEGDDVKRNGDGTPRVLVEPLISTAAYEELQHLLGGSAPTTRKRSKAALLTGLVRCAECGGSMKGRSADSPSASYVCSRRATQGAEACPGNAVGVHHLDAYVREWLKGYLSPGVVRDLAAAYEDAIATATSEAERIRGSLRNLEADRYDGGLYSGDTGAANFRARHANLSETLEDVEDALLELHGSPLPRVFDRAEDGVLPWGELSDNEVHTLAESVIDRIEVSKGQRGRPFSSERVNIIPAA